MIKVAALFVLLAGSLMTGCTTRSVETTPLGAPPTDSALRPPTDSAPRPYINQVTDPARQRPSSGAIRY